MVNKTIKKFSRTVAAVAIIFLLTYTSGAQSAAGESGNPDATAAKGYDPKTSTDDKWEFAFAPYMYLPALKGTVEARGRTAQIDQSIGDVLSHFKAGFMGTFEARHGKFLVVNDFMWTKSSEERATPGGLYNTGKVDVNFTIINPDVGYRLYEKGMSSFDVLGGVRVSRVKTSLAFTTGTLPGFTVEQSKTWAAPVVGGHGIANLSPKFYLSTFFDIGGGFGTHVTGQFYGGAGYRITQRIALVGGYRYLKNNYTDNKGFRFDTAMSGILIGAKFRLSH